MTKTEKQQLLNILDKEWEYLSHYDLNHHPDLIQYAAAVWQLLEFLPVRDCHFDPE